MLSSSHYYSAADTWFNQQSTKIYAAKNKGCWFRWSYQVLRPYWLLSESEKDYDRRKARELAAVVAVEADERLAALQHHFWRCCRVRSALRLPRPEPRHFISRL